jgi:hypothetical protein
MEVATRTHPSRRANGVAYGRATGSIRTASPTSIATLPCPPSFLVLGFRKTKTSYGAPTRRPSVS